MTKVLKLSEVGKKINIIDFTLTKEGLWVAYEMQGKELDLIANPEQTCDLLKRNYLIADYTGAEADVCVETEWITDEVDMSGDHRQLSGHSQQHWDEFILSNFSLTKQDVLNLVTTVEEDKLLMAQVTETFDKGFKKDPASAIAAVKGLVMLLAIALFTSCAAPVRYVYAPAKFTLTKDQRLHIQQTGKSTDFPTDTTLTGFVIKKRY